MATEQEKIERFKRVAENRTNKIINQIKAGIEYYNRFLSVKESKKVHLNKNIKFIKH